MSAHPIPALRTTSVLAVGAAALTVTLVAATSSPSAFLWIVGVGALAVGLVALVRRHGRSPSNGTLPASPPPSPFPGPGAIPAQPRPRAEKVLYRPLAHSGS